MNKKILLVDDSPDISKLVKTLLGRAGFNVTETTNGSEAKEQLEQRQFDLVLSDEEMPLMRGSELAAWIRKTELNREIPIIIMSGKDDPRLFCQLIEDKKISAYISKPFDNKSLSKLVSRYLNPENV